MQLEADWSDHFGAAVDGRRVLPSGGSSSKYVRWHLNRQSRDEFTRKGSVEGRVGRFQAVSKASRSGRQARAEEFTANRLRVCRSGHNPSSWDDALHLAHWGTGRGAGHRQGRPETADARRKGRGAASSDHVGFLGVLARY